MKKALSIILCLSMLMTSFPMSVFAAPVLAPIVGETTQETVVEEPATDVRQDVESTEDTVLASDQQGWNVYYEAGTSATVTGMPGTETAKYEYTVSSAVPERDGYGFEGWSLVPGGTEAVDELYVEKDVTLYAMWSRSSVTLDFKKQSDYDNHIGLSCVTDIAVDTTGDGYLTFTTIAGTGAPADVQIFYNPLKGNDQSKVAPIDDVSSYEIRLATDYAETRALTNFFFTSHNGAGTYYSNPLPSTDYTKNMVNTYVTYDGNINNFITFKVNPTVKDVWKGYLGHIRFDPMQGEAAVGKKVIIDYIKLTGIPSIEYVDLNFEGPAVSQEAVTAEDVVAGGETYKVESLEWSPALIGGVFFDTATSYTAKVTLKAAPGYVFSDQPAKAAINNNIANYSKIDDETAEVSFTFNPTEETDPVTLVNVTLHEKDNNGDVNIVKSFLSGYSVDLGSMKATSTPDGYRWMGWSSDAEEIQLVDVINLQEDADYYAVYELIEGFDYGNEYHRNGTESNVYGALSYVNGWAVVNPAATSGAVELTTAKTYANAVDYGKVEVIYDASLETNVGGVFYPNKFNENLVPELYFEAGGSRHPATLVDAVSCIAANTISYKYIYDVMLSEYWTGEIGALTVVPYTGNPAWAVKSIMLVKNEDITEKAVITGIDEPKTWATPDTDVKVNGNFEVVSVDWMPALNESGKFYPETQYTAAVTLKPASGYKIVNEEATVDGNDATAQINADGTMTVTYTYGYTENLIDFEIEIADGIIDAPDAEYTVTPVFTPEIEVSDITVEIVDNGPNGNCAIVVDNDTIKAVYDGTITIKATSVYDPSVSDTAQIVISNQTNYTITYVAGADNVTGMPETDQGKMEYNLSSQIPQRSGYSFAGWVKDPSDKVSITKDYVTGDTTYYALWVKGVNYEFIGETLPSLDYYLSTNGTYDTENGVYYVSSIPTNPSNPTSRPDPMISFNANRISGAEHPIVEIRFRTSATTDTEFSVYFQSVDENNNGLGWGYDGNPEHNADFVANRVGVPYNANMNGYTTLQINMSSKPDWANGYITSIRLDPFDGNAGAQFELDYIRIVRYETSVVEIDEIDTPVEKNVADTTAKSLDPSKVKVKSVTWEPELLHDYYFDGSTEYTVGVTVEGASGYFLSPNPVIYTINGEQANSYEYDEDNGTLTIYKTFPATGEIASAEVHEITLIGADDEFNEVEETRKVFHGDVFNLSEYAPPSIPAGYCWIGWTNGMDGKIIDSVVVNEDAVFYAEYELMTEIDYADPSNWDGTTSKDSAKDSIRFENDLAIITVDSSDDDTALITPITNVLASDFGLVEVYYSATHSAKYNGKIYPNIFNASLYNPVPALKFSTLADPANYSGIGTLVGAERVKLDGNTYYKYTYDMTTSALWTGKIGKLYLAPYRGYPEWGVRKIVFVPNEVVFDDIEIEAAVPETWNTPITVESVNVNAPYTVKSITWNGALNEFGTFLPETVYSATIVVGVKAGFTAVDPTIYVNDEQVEGIATGDSTYTITYTFGATEELKDVEVEISGSDSISSPGRYLQLSGKTVAVDGSKLPITDVTWSVDDKSIATVSKLGRVYPIRNGTLTVIATSVYDPSVSAEHVINIENQGELYTVTFNKNTQDTVEGVPEEVMTRRGTFIPESYNVKRNGYILLGWSKDEDALEPDESFTITEDTVLYAKWGKGYEWNCNSPADILNVVGGRTVRYENGIAYLSASSLNSPSTTLMDNPSLYTLGLSPEIYKSITVRISLPTSGYMKTFVTTIDSTTGAETAYNELASLTINSLSANNPGEFQIVTFDLSSHSSWNTYNLINRIRLDTDASAENEVAIDWIRLYDNNRTIKFDGNGGLIPFQNDYVWSYKKDVGCGPISLRNNVPQREGYEFVGWSKDPESFDKLYNSSFTVTDDLTLYAMWIPGEKYGDLDEEVFEEVVSVKEGEIPEDVEITSDIEGLHISSESEITPEIKVADEITVDGTNDTLVVLTTFDYADTSNNNIYFSFIPEGETEPLYVLISENPESSFSGKITADLSEIDEYTGTITDVKVVFQTGIVNELTVSEIVRTTAKMAETYGSDKSQDGEIGNVTVNGSDGDGSRGTLPTGSGSITSHVNSTVVKPDKQVTNSDAGGSASQPETKFPYVNTFGPATFMDVKTSDWFYGDVEKSYMIGLMNGKGEANFDPEGNVTLAEAITVASRVNALNNRKTIAAATQGQKWYDPYVAYATSTGIIKSGQFTDVTRAATRSEVAAMFANSMPSIWFTAKNAFTSIPDVPTSNAAYKQILLLYNAGVVVGVDDEHNFQPDTNIKRSEISAIINRVVLPESRIRAYTAAEIEKLTIYADANKLVGSSLTYCEQGTLELKDGLAYGKALALQGMGPDPIVYCGTNVIGSGIDASIYNTIEIGVKYGPDIPAGTVANIYFTTTEISWSGAARVDATYDGVKDANGISVLKFNMSRNANWKNIVTNFRFDPFSTLGEFSIAYVKLVPTIQ